jgi:outer membrane protein TolC
MKSVVFVLGTVLALATTTPAAGPGVTRALSLEECIRIALEHNFDIQIARYEPEIAQFNLSGSYGSYDPAFSLSGSRGYNLSPGGFDERGQYDGDESKTDSFASSIGGLMPWGLSYSLGGSVSDSYGTRPGSTTDFSNPTSVSTNTLTQTDGTQISYLTTNYSTVATRNPFEVSSGNVGFLTLRQPLLKDFWINQPRLQVFLRKKDVQYSEQFLRKTVIDTVTLVEAAYYNFIFAEENVEVQKKGLELAERLVAENRRRVEVGALAPLDEKQAEAQAAAGRANLLGAQAARDTAERLLKNYLSDDYSQWKDARIQATEPLLALPQSFDLQSSWRKGLTLKPELLQANVNLEKQVKVVSYQKNQVYPQLDLVGNFRYSASATAPGEFNNALGQLSDRDYPSHFYGAELTIPLANTAARNSLKTAKANREQLELTCKKVEQGVLIGIENSMGNARTSFERVQATRQARLFAEDALKAEQTKLEKGKSTSFFVLQLQRDLTNARSEEIRALADYNIDLAFLAQSEGSTLERRNIELQVKGK